MARGEANRNFYNQFWQMGLACAPGSRMGGRASGVVGMALVPAAVGGESPLADGAGVYVDELASGVVADAAGADGEGGIAQLHGGDAGDPEVEGIGFNVF